MADPVEVMARAMIGDERYEALPGISTYLERKSMPHGAEWSDRDELHADLSRALSALDAAGFAVVPKEPTEAMLDAAVIRVPDLDQVDWVAALFETGISSYQGLALQSYRAMLSAAQVKP